MSLDDKEVIAEFVVESREHLADIENQLLAIEAGGANIDGELVNTVFRAAHSIKGAAGFFGFTAVQELAHELENVLNLVRNRQLVPTAAMTDVLLRAADRLRAMVEDIEHSNEVDVSRQVAELRAAATAQPSLEGSPGSAACMPRQRRGGAERGPRFGRRGGPRVAGGVGCDSSRTGGIARGSRSGWLVACRPSWRQTESSRRVQTLKSRRQTPISAFRCGRWIT